MDKTGKNWVLDPLKRRSQIIPSLSTGSPDRSKESVASGRIAEGLVNHGLEVLLTSDGPLGSGPLAALFQGCVDRYH